MFGGVDPTAPPSGRARSRYPACNSIYTFYFGYHFHIGLAGHLSHHTARFSWTVHSDGQTWLWTWIIYLKSHLFPLMLMHTFFHWRSTPCSAALWMLTDLLRVALDKGVIVDVLWALRVSARLFRRMAAFWCSPSTPNIAM